MVEKQVTKLAAPEDFVARYEETVLGIRTAFTELLLSAGADPTRPSEIARRFHLNKNLTWMVSKIVNSDDVYAVAQHIPGTARIDSLLTAMGKAGATQREVAKLRSALNDFDRLVAEHTGDRETLELILAELSPDEARSERLLHSRKLAFRGNSGTLGVQTRVQMGGAIVAPNADDPQWADLVQLGGLYNFRRLRSTVRWLLFRRMRWEDDGIRSDAPIDEPLGRTADGVPMLEEFCSDPVPKVNVVVTAEETQYELPPGPVGNHAAMTCVYGSVLRRTGRLHRDPHNRSMELGCSLVTPAEAVVFDLFVHQSLTWALAPELAVFSRIQGPAAFDGPERERTRVVVTERVQPLGRGIGALVTPHLPRHVDLLRTVFERVGWNPRDFLAMRVVMEYPPIPAALLLISALPERAG